MYNKYQIQRGEANRNYRLGHSMNELQDYKNVSFARPNESNLKF